jgi:hypothetical protein
VRVILKCWVCFLSSVLVLSVPVSMSMLASASVLLLLIEDEDVGVDWTLSDVVNFLQTHLCIFQCTL